MVTSHVLVTEAGKRLALLSCTIRNTGSGWAVLNDAAHEPSGIAALVQHPDHIEIQHAATATQVSSVQVTPDETYAAQALRVGISVGLSLSRIYLYSGASTTPLDPATVAAANGNLWITGLMEL